MAGLSVLPSLVSDAVKKVYEILLTLHHQFFRVIKKTYSMSRYGKQNTVYFRLSAIDIIRDRSTFFSSVPAAAIHTALLFLLRPNKYKLSS